MSDPNNLPPISDPILRNIGLIAALWSALEVQLEFAILRHQEIDLSTGMLLTTNLGFQSKIYLLTTFANEGGIQPESEAKALLKLLSRIHAAYADRNLVVHSVWTATDDANIARCRGIRTRGKLRLLDEPMSVDRLAEIADVTRQIGADLTDFMERHNLTPENGA